MLGQLEIKIQKNEVGPCVMETQDHHYVQIFAKRTVTQCIVTLITKICYSYIVKIQS